jgi:uncharacterized protein
LRTSSRFLLGLLALFGFLCLFAPDAALAGGRIALIFGNGAYRTAPQLDNPANDAEEIAKSLKAVGFDVVLRRDATRADMTDALRDFSERIRNADVALFYYAGHGLQMEGENYLLPVDVKIQTPADVRFGTINLTDIQQEMAGAGRANIIILDACRNNPFAAQLAGHGRAVGSRGLGRVDATGVGSLIVFSTQPDNVALDGSGRNSPFAASLAKYLTTPGLEVRQMISKVRGEVLDATQQKQVPWDSSSLVGDVYLAAATAPVAATTSTPTPAPATPATTSLALAIDSPERKQPVPTGPAAECRKLTAPVPNFADPAIIKASRLQKDWPHALEVCKQAVDENAASTELQYGLGLAYYVNKDYLDALRHFTVAADAGDTYAQNQLGYMFVLGKGVVKDEHRAFEYFSKSAAAGNASAIGNLGSAYLGGNGVREDDAQALALFEKSIEAGNPFALVQTGVAYYNGKGVPRDYAAAEQYFQQAADLGDGFAMKFLAIMYERGLLGPPDANQAAQLRLRAAQEDPHSDTPNVPMPRVNVPQTTTSHTVRRVHYYRYIMRNCWPLC